MVRAVSYGPSESDVLASLGRSTDLAPDYPMAQAYAGCLIAQRCIENSMSLDPAKLRIEASKLDFTTFYGRFKIDPATGRQLRHVMPVVCWRSGTKEIVWPPEKRRG